MAKGTPPGGTFGLRWCPPVAARAGQYLVPQTRKFAAPTQSRCARIPRVRKANSGAAFVSLKPSPSPSDDGATSPTRQVRQRRHGSRAGEARGKRSL